jgi:hypothetical protein
VAKVSEEVEGMRQGRGGQDRIRHDTGAVPICLHPTQFELELFVFDVVMQLVNAAPPQTNPKTPGVKRSERGRERPV